MGFIMHFVPDDAVASSFENTAWVRHTIDSSSVGADGVRLGDANGDGFMDIATGWEEGGVVRTYINPGPAKAKEPWPAVTVGKVGDPEDAVFVDLDGDGAIDVVSCTEGQTRTVFVHWAPRKQTLYLDEKAWISEPILVTQGKQKWMFALPMQIDGKDGIDLVVGSKEKNATIGWLQSPKNPRDMKTWKFHPLCQVEWVMSLVDFDIDGDGDKDIIFSDRLGENSGVFWLENPGIKAVAFGAEWRLHRIGANGKEVGFLTLFDLDGDGLMDILVATGEGTLVYLRRTSKNLPLTWEEFEIANPFEVKIGKAVNIGDIDMDSRPDIVHTSERARAHREKSPGVVWMSYRKVPSEPVWESHDISGLEGIKFDLVQLLDVDDDGDLDVITCEEKDNLGVFWYENPTIGKKN